MASSVESFALPLPFFTPAAAAESSGSVSREELNLFHSIDRCLYSRLVLGLGRNAVEAMQVIALWLWLEDAAADPLLVKKLLDLPDDLLSAVTDEAVLCLRCVESDSLASVASALPSADEFIPLTQSLNNGGAVVSLQLFHENRLGVLRGVTKIVNEVCVRAFEDIIFTAAADPLNPAPETFPAFVGPPLTGFLLTDSVVGPGEGPAVAGPPAQMQLWGAYHPYDLSAQRQVVGNELGEMILSRLNLAASSEEEGALTKDSEIPPDDRTIFLTFSKGYPISESEVTDFFTKKFGECIEAIHMQEVPAEEQALYARMVVHAPAKIEEVLEGKSKAKFSIDGKHVWARKYVRKHHSKTSPGNRHSPTPKSPEQPSPKSGTK